MDTAQQDLEDGGWPHLDPCTVSLSPSIYVIVRQGNIWPSKVL